MLQATKKLNRNLKRTKKESQKQNETLLSNKNIMFNFDVESAQIRYFSYKQGRIHLKASQGNCHSQILQHFCFRYYIFNTFINKLALNVDMKIIILERFFSISAYEILLQCVFFYGELILDILPSFHNKSFVYIIILQRLRIYFRFIFISKILSSQFSGGKIR